MSQTPLPDNDPTRVRYGVLGFACVLSMITYLDRVAFGAAQSSIITALGLNHEGDLKWAITAFAFAYAAFEIPSGWLGDVFGPRTTLIRIVLWWSVFTALTGMIMPEGQGFFLLSGVTSLAVIRFLFGMGEAGAYPNLTRALHNWFPFSQRAVAQGWVWMAGRLMGGLTPLIWAFLVSGFAWWTVDANTNTATSWGVPPLLGSWRHAFFLFGAIGVVWCIAFSLWFRNTPKEKATVNQAELQLIQAGRHDTGTGHANVPWLKMLSSWNLWALCLMYFCASYGWYFNITYLHRFLETQYGVDPKSALGAIYKGGPLLFGATTCLLGGWLSDRFIRRTGNLKWGRRWFGIIGHSLCAVCYFLCLFTPTAFMFFLAISFAAFFNDLIMGPAWATCQDIGKRYAAIVAGAMNTVGNMGGAAAGWITGTILESYVNARAAAANVTVEQLSAADKAEALLPAYHINFIIFTVMYVIAVLLWLRIDPTQPVVPEPKAPDDHGGSVGGQEPVDGQQGAPLQ
jgi:MFS family permease